MRARRTVLAYHGVGVCPHPRQQHDCLCVGPEVFARQMAFLARHREVVSLGQLLASGPGDGAPKVAISFDDGYRNVLEHAAPVLRRHGFQATVFVPTRWIGGDNTWEEGGPCHPLPIMDEDELRAAEQAGIAVESHGHGHVDLVQAGLDGAAADLGASFARLSEVLGRPPQFLAYPYGSRSPLVEGAAQAAGFAAAFGFNAPESGPFGHERVSIDGREGWLRLRLKTAGGYLARRHSPAGTAAVSVVRRVVPRPGGQGGA